MLRLKVAPSLPWVDSQSRVRSPFENMVLLDESARRALDGGSMHGLVAWEIGVVSDDWDVPLYSKPVEIGADDGASAMGTFYAVGSSRAEELSLEVAPLWLGLFDFLLKGRQAELLLHDAVWDTDRHEWLDMHEALAAGLLGTPLPSHQSTLDDWCWLEGGTSRLIELIGHWWPSAAGGAVVVQRQLGDSRPESISSAELGEVDVYAMTSKAYDNLGFQILTRVESWDVLRERLESRGWFDGVALEDAVGREK